MSSVNDGNITKEPSDGGSGGGGYSPPIPQSDVTDLVADLAALEALGTFTNPHPCGQATGFPVGELTPATALPGTIPYGYCISATLSGVGGVITSLSFDAGATSSDIFKRNGDNAVNYGWVAPQGGEWAFGGTVIFRWASILGNDSWEIYDFRGITPNDITSIVEGTAANGYAINYKNDSLIWAAPTYPVVDLGVSTGTANAIACSSFSDTTEDFALDTLYVVKANGTNTSAVTVAKNGGTPVALKKSPSSAALVAGDIVNGSTIGFFYDGTDLEIVSGLALSALPGAVTDGQLPATSNNSTISAISTVANAAVPKATVDAKGDLIVGTANDTVGRLAVGTNGQVLTADSAETTGAKWATVSATDATKMPLAGGDFSGVLTYSATAMSLFANTADGADNKSIIIGGGGASGQGRGADLLLTGNEHASAGQAILSIGGIAKFQVKQASSVLFQVDGNSGNCSAAFGFSCGALTATTGSFSGALSLTGTQTSPGTGVNHIYRDASANQFYNAGNSNSNHNFGAAGTSYVSLGPNGVILTGTQTSLGASVANLFRNSSGDITQNVNTGGSHILSVNGSNVTQTSAVNGIHFASTASGPSAGSPLICLYSGNILALQGSSAGYAQIGCNSTNAGGRLYVCGAVAAVNPGMVVANPVAASCFRTSAIATAVPTGGAWTTIAPLAGVNQGLLTAIVTGMGSILMDWDGTTLTKLAGATTLVVAGSAGGTEVAFRVNASNLQASNGTGSSKNASNPSQDTH